MYILKRIENVLFIKSPKGIGQEKLLPRIEQKPFFNIITDEKTWRVEGVGFRGVLPIPVGRRVKIGLFTYEYVNADVDKD